MKSNQRGAPREPRARARPRQDSQAVDPNGAQKQRTTDCLPHPPEPLQRRPRLVLLAVQRDPQHLDPVVAGHAP
eukprot:5879364-Pyramimonas_sp.AAC.1